MSSDDALFDLRKDKAMTLLEFLSKLSTTCISFLERNICKMTMFDEILITCYNYLNYQFSNFKSSNEYINLISAINYQTYLRCKFIQCGLMVKE